MSSTYPTSAAPRLSEPSRGAPRTRYKRPSRSQRAANRPLRLPVVPVIEEPVRPFDPAPHKGTPLWKRALRRVPLLVGVVGLADYLDYVTTQDHYLNVPANWVLHSGPCGDFSMACANALFNSPPCPLLLQACAGVTNKPGIGTSVFLPNVSAVSFGFPHPSIADRYNYTVSYRRVDNTGDVLEWVNPAPLRVPIGVPVYGHSPLHRPLRFEWYEPIPTPYPNIPSVPAGPPAPGGQGRQVSYGRRRLPYWPEIDVSMRPGQKPRVQTRKPTGFPRPPARNETERKIRFRDRIHAATNILNITTEGVDIIKALHKALPKECRAKPVALVGKDLRAQLSRKAQARKRDLRRRIELYRGNVIKSKFKLTKDQRELLSATVPDGVEVYRKPRFYSDGTFKIFRTHRAPTPYEQFQAINKCFDHMPMATFTKFFNDAFENLQGENMEDLFYGKLGQAMAEGASRSKIGSIGGFTTGPAL